MDVLVEGVRQAIGLLLGGDREILAVLWLSLQVSTTATLIALLLGIPAGAALALAGWMLWCVAVSGYPWPNTRYVKGAVDLLVGLQYLVLEVLLQRAGRLVSKDQLVERLCEWGDEVSNNAIEVYVHRLRKKIEQGSVRIATVRGLGYCLERIAA